MDLRVSTAEFIRNFSRLAIRALNEPVFITKSGRDQLVVMSAEEYRRLKRGERKVYRTGELPGELATAIASSEPPPEASAFNHEIEDR